MLGLIAGLTGAWLVNVGVGPRGYTDGVALTHWPACLRQWLLRVVCLRWLRTTGHIK